MISFLKLCFNLTNKVYVMTYPFSVLYETPASIHPI